MEFLCTLFLIFIFYSVFGWAMEVVVTLNDTGKMVNRGFLVGPVCPIYGLGAILITLLLKRYLDDPVVLFVMAVVICSLLEYFTSYIMEKLFRARWWDYSDKKFNLNGRVCLENLVAFGALGIIAMYVINPFLNFVIGKFNLLALYIVSGVIATALVVDIGISLKVISGFKNIAKTVRTDSTEEITKKVKEILNVKGGLYKRLANAFNFQASEKLLRELMELKDKASDSIDRHVTKAKKVIETEKVKRKEQRRKIKEEYRLKVYKLKEMLDLERRKEKEELKKLK